MRDTLSLLTCCTVCMCFAAKLTVLNVCVRVFFSHFITLPQLKKLGNYLGISITLLSKL